MFFGAVEGTGFEVFDPRFSSCLIGHARVERLWTGARWAEGPAWFAAGRYLVWSDIPNNRMLRYDDCDGAVSVFRQPSNNANGNTRDRQGRLVTCEHDSRRVTRTEYDGSITVLADNYRGKKLNSPNDVVVSSDGSVWFTDPQFGILGYYEGQLDTSEVAPAIYRIDGQTGVLSMVADEIPGPNGLAFSPDEKILYVVASRADPREIRAFDVVDGSRLANGRVFINAADGSPDGFRVDIEGNLWCGWGMGTEELDGVRVFNPEGAAIGHIRLPERAANLCFGGRHRNRLFMTASGSPS